MAKWCLHPWEGALKSWRKFQMSIIISFVFSFYHSKKFLNPFYILGGFSYIMRVSFRNNGLFHLFAISTLKSTYKFSKNSSNLLPIWLLQPFCGRSKPVSLKHFKNLSLGIGFVNMSVALSEVCTFKTSTSPFSIWSQTKWNFMSMSFVLWWNCGFLESCMVLGLSQ